MREWTFESSSGGKPYTTILADDNKLLCDCRGWTMRKGEQARHCKHTKDVVKQLKATIIQSGEFTYIDTPGADQSNLARTDDTMESTKDRIKPMLASAMTDAVTGTAFDERYSEDEWTMEEKFDGHRCIAKVNNGVIEAYSRPRQDGVCKTRTLPTNIIDILKRFPDGTYDGEIVAPSGKSWEVTVLGTQLAYVLFDIVELPGYDTLSMTQEDRDNLLWQVYADVCNGENITTVRLSISYKPSWSRVKKIWSDGGEGVILKRRKGLYRPGYRTPDWVKVKALHAASLTITGYKAGKLGPYSTVKLVDDAGVETTVKTLNNATLRELAENPESFIGRKLVISYQEKTPDGTYRHPMWDHLL